MKKTLFLIGGLIIATSMSYAQKLESIVVLDYDNVPLLSSSPNGSADIAIPTVNPYPTGINESAVVGKYVHKSGIWITEEQQVGYRNQTVPDIDLRYYTGIEFMAYIPSTTNKGPFWLELQSDGPNSGAGDPSVQRENWSRLFVQQPTIPIDSTTMEPMTDQWFKISYDNIISARKLGMIAFGYRRGANVPSGEVSKEVVYFDNFVMNPSKATHLCLYRESFFIKAKENNSWTGNSNSDIVMYPGTDWSVTIQKGANRWVGGVELKSDEIALEWNEDDAYTYDHSLFMSKQSSDLTIEDIDVSGSFTDLKLSFDIKGNKNGVTPNIEYKVDEGEWTAVNMGAVTENWTTKSYTISVVSANKVSVRISGKTMAEGSILFDNLTIYGTDRLYIPNSINNSEGDANLNIYLNPATNILMIDGEVNKVEIYNTQGTSVYSGSADGGVNMFNLPTGVYVVKLFTEQGITSSKVFKK